MSSRTLPQVKRKRPYTIIYRAVNPLAVYPAHDCIAISETYVVTGGGCSGVSKLVEKRTIFNLLLCFPLVCFKLFVTDLHF